MKRRYIVNIDPVNYCPLRCPSCPQGTRRIESGPITYLQPEQIRNILDIVTRQVNVHTLFLFNFHEPFLNPKLPEIIRESIKFVPNTVVSTSGSTKPAFDLAELVDARPNNLTVGISGWSQAVYETTHVGGDINKVKSMLVDLYDLSAGKMVWLVYHRYKNNLHEEDLAKAFAHKLGFHFRANWAGQLDLESILERKNGTPHYVMGVEEQLAIVKDNPQTDCRFWNTAAILPNGDLRLCADSTDYSRETGIVGNVFRDSMESMRETIMASSLCGRCRAMRAYQVACCVNTKCDKFMADRVAVNPLKYKIERFRKRIWKIKEGTTMTWNPLKSET